ncbi:MAG: LytTR family DNA-binding domain-containing protein [Spirochaetota bacterium]|nr:LytTR family DNA-binding domain-containing protein [Spirochaetota bacterium]
MKEVNNISVVLAEDEQPARELLIKYILDRPELTLEDIARNGEEALELLSSKWYDLLFLDINLPILSGIEVIERLDYSPYVIFTTAYDKYAIKAFDIGAIDYLLKPFDKKRFNQAVDKAISIIKDKKTFNLPHKLGLYFKENENHYILPFDEIIYLSSHASHTIVNTEERSFETAQLLKEIGKKLPENLFVRIHKQYIVNLQFVSHIQYVIGGQYMVYLKDENETTLPVGRKFATTFKEKLKI